MAISNEIRPRIVGLSRAGTNGVEIAAIVGVCVRTVQRLVKKFKEDGTCGGSSKKLSDTVFYNTQELIVAHLL